MTKRRRKKTTPEKYLSSHPATLMMLVAECGMVNARGEIAWTKVAKCLNVSPKTLLRWRNPLDKANYKSKFAIAAKEVQAAVDLDKTKRDVITASRFHLRHKVTRELRSNGPKMPPSSYTIPLLLRYAKEVLGLDLTRRNLNKTEILYKTERRIEELAEEKMVVVRKETTLHPPEPAAAKMVLANHGPEHERWIERAKIKHTGQVNIRPVMFVEQKRS